MNADDNFFTALKPMRVIYSFIGCSYTSYLKRHKRKSSKGEKLFGLTTKILTLLVLVSSLWGLFRCTKKYKTVTAAINFIIAHINIFVTASNVLLAFLNRKNLTNTLAKFVAVDSQLQRISTVITYRRSRRRVIIALTLCAILQLLKLIMDGLAGAAGLLRPFCMSVYMLSYTSTLIIECYLVLLLVELKVRFGVLNNHIAGIIDTPLKKTTSVSRFRMVVANSSSDSFIRSAKLHSELCEIGKLINGTFEGHILIINFASFVHVVSSFFHLVEVVDKKHYFKDLCNYFYILYWILTYVAETFVMFCAFTSVTAEKINLTGDPKIRHCVNPSFLLHSLQLLYYVFCNCRQKFFEAKKTASILHTRKSLNTKIKHSDLIVIFTKQLYFQNAKFTVYQLYPIDWTALFFILCNVFTFLIILLQFNSIIINDTDI